MSSVRQPVKLKGRTPKPKPAEIKALTQRLEAKRLQMKNATEQDIIEDSDEEDLLHTLRKEEEPKETEADIE